MSVDDFCAQHALPLCERDALTPMKKAAVWNLIAFVSACLRRVVDVVSHFERVPWPHAAGHEGL